MEIEFLILQQGAGTEPVLDTNLGVGAQALRHMSILRDNVLSLELFDMCISVPEPEAYALHKMVINSQRGDKAEKDKAAIRNIMPHLNYGRVRQLYETLMKKEKRLADAFCAAENLSAPEREPEFAGG